MTDASEPAFHLAEINIALPLEPLTSERLAGFVEALEPVNALADAAPGFVWRLKTEDGDATAIRPFDDDRVIVNMTVWESAERLAAFVYGPEHAAVMRQRRSWFVPMREAYTVAWWIPAGSAPTLDEAIERLETLRRFGPTPRAFTISRAFGPPSAPDPMPPQDDWMCPA